MAAAAATAATKGNGGGGGRAGAGEGGGTRKKKGPGPVATAYLVIYNVVMTAGWLVIAVGFVRAYLAKGSYHNLYYSIEKPLKFFQTGALLECSNFTFANISTNSGKPNVQSEDSVLLFVIAWTVTEIIRYSFYTFSLLNHLPYIIKWARILFLTYEKESQVTVTEMQKHQHKQHGPFVIKKRLRFQPS
ncbi:hypothetical protein A6R68_00904, partial [Neotoma lepida]